MSDSSSFTNVHRALPVVRGLEHLSFRCTGCGKCCRGLRVAVTHHDVRRLVEATGEVCSSVVAWLTPDEVDMTGEPESFVELANGRRLMVLAQVSGACRFLDDAERCRVYDARPRDCRAFPFHLEPESDGVGQRLSLLALVECDHARDGAVDPARVALDDRRRWEELAEYQTFVARWNRLARHRQRLRRRLGTADDFFAFLGLRARG